MGAPDVLEVRPGTAALVVPGAQSLPVSGVRGGLPHARQDWVADEVPVALEVNGISHAVMLATPLDLEDFALGFALSEGILASASELFSVDETASEAGITLKMRVCGAAFDRLKLRRRSMAGRTGCGLCGTESLSQVARDLPPLPARPAIRREAVAKAMAQLSLRQTLQHATGAVHAAAWCNAEGDVGFLREDVGRHNALDKVIGALARKRADASAGFMVVTSRASFEMVQKTVSAGVPLLAAVSAATSYAIEAAERSGLALLGFTRGDDFVAYSHAERLQLPSPLAAPPRTPHAH